MLKTNNKGITLIALIITIIVMLILVGVTISVALNGEIFNNATDATVKTQKAVSKEELISVMVGAYNSIGSFDKDLVGTLPSGAKWCKENETYASATNDPDECDWIVTENGDKFYIDESGSVLDEKPQGIDTLIPDESEINDAFAFGNGLLFAENETYQLLYIESALCYINISSGSGYIWIISDELASQAGLGTFKWYKEIVGESGTEYEESSPNITASSFTTVYSESYLNRVLGTL